MTLPKELIEWVYHHDDDSIDLTEEYGGTLQRKFSSSPPRGKSRGGTLLNLSALGELLRKGFEKLLKDSPETLTTLAMLCRVADKPAFTGNLAAWPKFQAAVDSLCDLKEDEIARRLEVLLQSKKEPGITLNQVYIWLKDSTETKDVTSVNGWKKSIDRKTDKYTKKYLENYRGAGFPRMPLRIQMIPITICNRRIFHGPAVNAFLALLQQKGQSPSHRVRWIVKNEAVNTVFRYYRLKWTIINVLRDFWRNRKSDFETWSFKGLPPLPDDWTKATWFNKTSLEVWLLLYAAESGRMIRDETMDSLDSTAWKFAVYIDGQTIRSWIKSLSEEL